MGLWYEPSAGYPSAKVPLPAEYESPIHMCASSKVSFGVSRSGRAKLGRMTKFGSGPRSLGLYLLDAAIESVSGHKFRQPA